MERRHYNLIADIIATAPIDYATRVILANYFAERLAGTNLRFNRERFIAACMKD